MDDLSRYQLLAARYRNLAGENEELRQLVDLIKENQELKEYYRSLPPYDPPQPRAIARRLFEEESESPRRPFERFRPIVPTCLYPEPRPEPTAVATIPNILPVVHSPQPRPVDNRRRVIQLTPGPYVSPPGRGCFIPANVLDDPRVAHIVGTGDLHNKYFLLDLTPLRQKPVSELADKYFGAPLASTPQSPAVAMAPVLASTPQSPAVAMAPFLAVAPQSATGVLEHSSRYYTAISSPTADIAPVLLPPQQSPTGGLDIFHSHFSPALPPPPQQSPTGGLDIFGSNFSPGLSSSQQGAAGGLDLSGKYFAPILPSPQQSPTGGLDIFGSNFSPGLSSSQQGAAGGLDLSGKYFAPVPTSRGFSDQEASERASSHSPFKDSKQENMERIVGEIAFQLDRRILSAVFPDRNRLYGFTVSNIPKKVQQGGNDPYCKLDDAQAAAIMERYNAVMNRLKPLGYDPHSHPRLTEHVVNTFGILRERPELSGAEAASYNNVQNLQSVVRETVSPDLRNECLMLLSCLAQLSQDDGKPMFIW